MRAIAVIVAGLMLSSVSSVQPARADAHDKAATTAEATDFSAAKKRKKNVRSVPRSGAAPRSNFEAVRGQTFGAERAAVACTRSGCQGVPRGCLREPERSFNGDPTGFDSIVCPPR